jgi:hypothetical protein
MHLGIESDASYFSVSKAQPMAAGYFYLPATPNIKNTKTHKGVLKESHSSLAEAGIGELFHNSKEACPLCATLTALGHPRNATTIVTPKNSTASGIINATVKSCQSKAIKMRFPWLQDRVSQGQFTVVWKKGK